MNKRGSMDIDGVVVKRLTVRCGGCGRTEVHHDVEMPNWRLNRIFETLRELNWFYSFDQAYLCGSCVGQGRGVFEVREYLGIHETNEEQDQRGFWQRLIAKYNRLVS